MKSIFGIALLSLLSTSCALVQTSDKNLVANSTSAYMWQHHVYKKDCVETSESTAPENCKQRYSLLKELREDVHAANEAQKIGKLPESARLQLKTLMKRLEAKWAGSNSSPQP